MSYRRIFWKLPGANRAPVARETGRSIRGSAFQLRRLKIKEKFNTEYNTEVME